MVTNPKSTLVPKTWSVLAFTASLAAATASPALAQSFVFSSGNPDGLMASASRPEGPGLPEIESADDFFLTDETLLRQATFTGLVPAGSNVTQVVVEIYRVFPLDSTLPASGRVPTRNNSPSDVAFDTRDSAAKGTDGKLTFDLTVIADRFDAADSVVNGIAVLAHPEGAVSGREVQFEVTFPNPIDLPPGPYFFIPQVKLDSGDFLWLSAPRPIVAPGTPISPDRQSWIRNEALAPDWLRIGADIVGGSPAPAFNGSFSLHGTLARR